MAEDRMAVLQMLPQSSERTGDVELPA